MVSFSGALSGAAAGSTFGPWGAAAGGLAGLFLGGKGDDVGFEDQRSPEQIAAAKSLQGLAQTGSGAGINLGEAYGGSLGSFDPTQFEQAGLAQLFQPQAGTKALSGAEDVFSRLSGAAFDPSMLDPFTKAARKSGREASTILDREAAITGSRFGTGIQQRKGELSADVESGIQQQLANLFMNQQNVSMQGAQGLAGVGQAQAAQGQQGLQNLFNAGSLERNLKNQEAQAQFNEFNRQRGETLSRVDLLQGEANRNPLLGVSSIPGSPSGFSTLINSVLGSAGKGFGESFGKKIGEDGIGSIFKKKETGGTV